MARLAGPSATALLGQYTYIFDSSKCDSTRKPFVIFCYTNVFSVRMYMNVFRPLCIAGTLATNTNLVMVCAWPEPASVHCQSVDKPYFSHYQPTYINATTEDLCRLVM